MERIQKYFGFYTGKNLDFKLDEKLANMLKKEDIDAILAELAEVKQENAKLNEKVLLLEHRL